MRVLNSTAAHSALPAEWEEEESFMDTALHRLHTHTHSKALTHPSSTVECEISNLNERCRQLPNSSPECNKTYAEEKRKRFTDERNAERK
ncbi:Heat shock 70 kDa protein 4 [Dissostichus eleginoides]|uniref:Heat shock 70 kDa protein 4 n=1 Tax=Dissostichus eleginoides TaxID=100907 RepID=A0AAD9F7C4_DISEL|nr:Heat shock 70 kDa protein 4 [Dissostichus eleginoides]